MKNTLLFLLLLTLSLSEAIGQNALYNNVKIESTKKYKDGNKYQQDFLLFIDMLESTHPAFAKKKTTPINLNMIRHKGYKWSEKCSSKEEFKVYLQSIMSKIGDAHSSVMLHSKDDYRFPLYFEIIEGKNYLIGINAENKEHLNKEIKSINGTPSMDVINSFKDRGSFENENFFYEYISYSMQSKSLWDFGGNSTDSLGIAFSDNTRITIYPSLNNQMSWSNFPIAVNTPRASTEEPFLYKIIEDNSICYLQFNRCIDHSTINIRTLFNSNISKEEIRQKASKYQRFDDFIKGMFDEMSRKNIETLVVDVRDNPGGNSMLCDILLSYLKSEDATKNFSAQKRISKLFEINYPDLSDTYKKHLEGKYKIGRLYKAEELPDLDESMMETVKPYFKMNEGKIYEGRTIFIQNNSTFSSAGWLITKARDNNIGIIIGSKSGYRPNTYGETMTWILPNTKIEGRISGKVFYRPNKHNNEDSLIPDVLLNETWEDRLNRTDRCWEWIVRHKK